MPTMPNMQISTIARTRAISDVVSGRTTWRPDKKHFAIDGNSSQIGRTMLILVIFILGVGNFALHRAVLESGHPIIRQMPWFGVMGGRLSLLTEFLVLLGALMLVATGQPDWAWAYVAYSSLNAIAGWAMLTGRI